MHYYVNEGNCRSLCIEFVHVFSTRPIDLLKDDILKVILLMAMSKNICSVECITSTCKLYQNGLLANPAYLHFDCHSVVSSPQHST